MDRTHHAVAGLPPRLTPATRHDGVSVILFQPDDYPVTTTIHHTLNSLDPAGGGVPMVAVQIAAAQAQRGERVSLHAIAHARDADQRGVLPEPDLAVQLEHLPGIDRVEIYRHHTRRELRSSLSSAAAEAGWFQLHGVWDPALLTAATVARKHHRPYAVTPHGMLDPWSLTQSRLKKKLGLFLAHRKMLNRAAFLQTLNEDEKRLMRPLKLRSTVEVVPNGVHLPDIQPALAREELTCFDNQLTPGRFFLFLARLHYKKGIDILLDAYAKLSATSPDPLDESEVWPLVIAGPDEGMGSLIQERVRQDQFPGRVVVPGPVYGTLKSSLLATAGGVVLPSRQEGFSLTILEALASERPAIISDQCHFGSVGAAQAGAVVRVDVDATAQAMRDLMEMSEDARCEMGRRGRRLVEHRYTWDRVAEMMITLYDKHSD